MLENCFPINGSQRLLRTLIMEKGKLQLQTERNADDITTPQQTSSEPLISDSVLSVDGFRALLSDSNHDHLTFQIVTALGGIDNILTEYIRITREYENEELLSGSEMQNIADLIATVPTSPTGSMFTKLYSKAKLMDNTFHLNSSDTVWHKIFADQTIADRIMGLLFHRCTRFIVGIAIIVWFTIGIILPVAVDVILLLILFIFATSIILCCNVPVLLLILTSFDFWMKLIYSIAFSNLCSIYLRSLNLSKEKTMLFDIGEVILVLLIINVSLIEGYHGRWRFSFVFGLLMSLFFSFFAINLTFQLYDFGKVELELGFGFSIDLVQSMRSCCYVLAFFLWRQTLMAVYTRGKRCICFNTCPYIKWSEN